MCVHLEIMLCEWVCVCAFGDYVCVSVCDNCRYAHLDGWADKSSRKKQLGHRAINRE